MIFLVLVSHTGHVVDVLGPFRPIFVPEFLQVFLFLLFGHLQQMLFQVWRLSQKIKKLILHIFVLFYILWEFVQKVLCLLLVVNRLLNDVSLIFKNPFSGPILFLFRKDLLWDMKIQSRSENLQKLGLNQLLCSYGNLVKINTLILSVAFLVINFLIFQLIF